VSAVTLDAEYCRALLPPRDPEGHKYTFGRVTTVCGSLDYAGAAYLASLGAARGGAGLVAMAVPDALRTALAAKLPEAILITASLDSIAERTPDSLVIGPGLQESDDVRELVLALIGRIEAPKVVDAGALSILSRVDDWWSGVVGEIVLTPHPGEFELLSGAKPGSADDDRLAAAQAAAERFGQIVVLKGPRTVVATAGGRAAISTIANAALATAGSGDVLAGLIGALLAQGANSFDAACLGVYLHARAGERLSMRLGNAGVLASDIAHEIPSTRHELDAPDG
jgi:hydroxyethylthiazole kinase-like uncharacterized protein yjeF